MSYTLMHHVTAVILAHFFFFTIRYDPFYFCHNKILWGLFKCSDLLEAYEKLKLSYIGYKCFTADVCTEMAIKTRVNFWEA